MNNNLIQIVFVIDKSGSMRWLSEETVSGFNSFIDRYRQEDADAIITTTLFDDYSFFLHDSVNLKEVQPLTVSAYQGASMGCTALYDAVGNTIDHVGERLAGMAEESRPCKVIFAITTDGFENASRHYTRERVMEMIRHQTDVYSWEFIFLGANIDAEQTAESIGISSRNAANYGFTPQGVQDVYYSVATAACNSSKGISVSATMDALKDEDGFLNSCTYADVSIASATDDTKVTNKTVDKDPYRLRKDDWTQLEDGSWVML